MFPAEGTEQDGNSQESAAEVSQTSVDLFAGEPAASSPLKPPPPPALTPEEKEQDSAAAPSSPIAAHFAKADTSKGVTGAEGIHDLLEDGESWAVMSN